jgi:PAS domain S-box-containing protein
VNDAAVKVLGYSREELRSMKILDIDLSLDPEKIKGLVKGMPTDKIQVFETAHTTKDGKTIPVEISSSLVTYQGKRAILSIARDITERKKMEERLLESEERLRTLYENIPDSLCVFVGKDGHLLEYNKAFKERTGYTDEELKDMKFLDFVHPDDRTIIGEKYGTRRPEEAYPLVFEMKEISKNGEPLPIQVSVSAYKKKGKVIGIEVLHRDIAERKRMEEELRRYSEHLEELVAERTKELRQAQERILESERLAAVGKAASMVGHDLRNPLTGIANAAYYLKKHLRSNTDEKTREMLGIIEKSIEHSNGIISDLLEYSREISLDLTENSLKSIIKDSLLLVKIPENIRLTDTCQSELRTIVDLEKMKRVCINIIKNAIDAMPQGGTLTIASRGSNGKLEITFADSGVGMSKEVLERLGTPFFTTKAKGMGLGFSICKRIVEAHGGRISVESAVGKGTTFTIIVPIKPELEGGEKIWVKTPESSLLTTTKA